MAKTFSVSVRLQRVTTETTHVSVPLSAELWQPNPDGSGTKRINTEKLTEAAIESGGCGNSSFESAFMKLPGKGTNGLILREGLLTVTSPDLDETVNSTRWKIETGFLGKQTLLGMSSVWGMFSAKHYRQFSKKESESEDACEDGGRDTVAGGLTDGLGSLYGNNPSDRPFESNTRYHHPDAALLA